MTKLERLKKAMLETRWARDDIWRKRESERERSIAEAAKRIDAELSAKYGDELDRLCKAYTEAFEAHETAVVENTLANLPYPIGMKFIGWHRNAGRHWFPQRNSPYEAIASGVVEVRTPETKFPENIQHGLPDVGEVFIRILKKDGTPSLKFDKISRGKYKWLPEGEKPSP